MSIAWSAPLAARADAYPTKPVTVMIASTPGGILDVVGRIVVRGLEKLGQPTVATNVPGAGGQVGTQTLLRAPADGYLLGMIATSHAINPSVYAKMPYDTLRDFTTVSHTVNITNLLVVHPSVPANTVQEFIALAKAKPNTMSCGSAGNGQSNHLSLELFNTAAGIKLMHIPYKGSAQAMNDVMGGSLTCMFVVALSATQLVAAGKLKALAATSATRLRALPNVPTFAESGMPGFAGSSWLALVVRSGTPKDVVDKIGENVAQTFNDAEVRNRLLSMGIEPVGALPGPSARFMETEIVRYGEVVKTAGVKVD
jgi:tripartite-type tricarboxylate transporter receptor subunit TctC